MKRIWATTAIVGGSIVLAGVALALSVYVSKDRAEKGHFTRDETELKIANLTGARVRLFRSGKNLSQATELTAPTGEGVFLSRGNYFLRTDHADTKLFYPIPILGYRRGPDANGSLAVTIRSLPDVRPSAFDGGLPQWVVIPGGSFVLGDRLNPQEPHYVWLPTFFMSVFEVTNSEFRQFLQDAQGWKDSRNWSAEGLEWRNSNSSKVSALLTEHDEEFGRFGELDQPVTWITWYEAAAYCHWLTRKFGAGKWIFSLPSEAEWEKAARGPDGFDYGLSSSLSDEESVYYNWKKNPGAPETVVGIEKTRSRFQPNRYGIFHLSGNVVEWTQTKSVAFSREHPYLDDDGRNSGDSGSSRVARGGSWYSASIALLSTAYRDVFQPGVRNHDLGFRIVARPIP